MMSKQVTILIYLNLFTAYLEAETNYIKPKLERNNIVNKGLWIRKKLDRRNSGDFIFRANSLDVDDVLQNNFDAFGENHIANSPFFSGYVDRSKRSTNEKSDEGSRKKLKCVDKSNCPNTDEKSSIVKSKLISTLKPASVFNDYPYEVAVLLSNKKDHLDDFSDQEIDIYNKDGMENRVNFKKNVTKSIFTEIDKDDFTTLNDNFNTRSSKDKINSSHTTRYKPTHDIIPKRNTNQREYETELIKKLEFTENHNTTDVIISKIDSNVFDKNDVAWHNTTPPSINIYKISSKKQPNKKYKPITERGLIKVLSMLTKTFKKIMKHHHDIKRIHNKLYDLNDDFMKNAESITYKLEDFHSKYLFLMKVNEELKVMKAKLREKDQSFTAKEKELSKNLKEFQNQQKKFLAQQQQFYSIQKSMLAQNEKINFKQNVIAKTQNEISHRQINFARILKKAKQIYIDSKSLSPTKLNTAIAKPKIKPTKDKTEPLKVFPTKISTTAITTTISPTSTDTMKINLFSIPALTRLENQDQMILDEKDNQPVDDLIYKYYFNNTFIDDLMKNKILATFIAASEGTDNNNIKSKRNEIVKLNTTILLPVNKTVLSNGSKKLRNRRWIKHSKRNNRKKESNASTAPVIIKVPPIIKENTAQAYFQSDSLKVDPQNKADPFTTMALNFCKEIGQSVNSQILNWCIEKALRRLQVIDSKISPLMALSTTRTSSDPQISQNDVTVYLTETSPTLKLQTQNDESRVTTEAYMFFPDNDELESKLKEYELKPDTEGTVYYDGSLHESDIERIGEVDSDGFSDIMPGLDSNSGVQVDPMTFDLQTQRRADVRKINARIMKMRMD